VLPLLHLAVEFWLTLQQVDLCGHALSLLCHPQGQLSNTSSDIHILVPHRQVVKVNTRAPFRHWAAAFLFLVDEVARAVVATAHFVLEPPELEGGVVIGGVVIGVVASVILSSSPAAMMAQRHKESKDSVSSLLPASPITAMRWCDNCAFVVVVAERQIARKVREIMCSGMMSYTNETKRDRDIRAIIVAYKQKESIGAICGALLGILWHPNG
jgi:hypothetical protein